MSALVFMDTETTGLSLDDDIWEFAAIRREEDGSETELHLFIEHDGQKCRRLPDQFRADHALRFPGSCSDRVVKKSSAAREILHITRDKAHVVGAVPNFDTERLTLFIRENFGGLVPWHYHLIDVENLAVGYLHGLLSTREGYLDSIGNYKNPTLPWDSNELSLAVGVDPEQFERHTAMGDVRWAMAIYDAITKSSRAS